MPKNPRPPPSSRRRGLPPPYGEVDYRIKTVPGLVRDLVACLEFLLQASLGMPTSIRVRHQGGNGTAKFHFLWIDAEVAFQTTYLKKQGPGLFIWKIVLTLDGVNVMGAHDWSKKLVRSTVMRCENRIPVSIVHGRFVLTLDEDAILSLKKAAEHAASSPIRSTTERMMVEIIGMMEGGLPH